MAGEAAAGSTESGSEWERDDDDAWLKFSELRQFVMRSLPRNAGKCAVSNVQ